MSFHFINYCKSSLFILLFNTIIITSNCNIIFQHILASLMPHLIFLAIIHIYFLSTTYFVLDLHARLHLTVVCMIIAPVTSDNTGYNNGNNNNSSMSNFKDGGQVFNVEQETSTNTCQTDWQLVGRSEKQLRSR